MAQLCVSRAIAGIGGGGMNSVVSILVSDIVPLRDRGLWQGYINVIIASGTSTGAPLGGILADSIGWRWYAGRLYFHRPDSIIAHIADPSPGPSWARSLYALLPSWPSLVTILSSPLHYIVKKGTHTNTNGGYEDVHPGQHLRHPPMRRLLVAWRIGLNRAIGLALSPQKRRSLGSVSRRCWPKGRGRRTGHGVSRRSVHKESSFYKRSDHG